MGLRTISAFADSSAIAKRYLKEPGSETVRAASLSVVSSLTAVEVSSAIWKRHRMGDLAASVARTQTAAARSDLTGGDPAIIVIPPTTPIVASASELTGTAGLRAYDALQLATAIVARDTYPDLVDFLCFDEQLCTAAATHGFKVIGPGVE